MSARACLSTRADLPDSASRPHAAYIRGMMSSYPSLRPLVLVLKYMLLQRHQHETFSGGVGSFLLFLMVLGPR